MPIHQPIEPDKQMRRKETEKDHQQLITNQASNDAAVMSKNWCSFLDDQYLIFIKAIQIQDPNNTKFVSKTYKQAILAYGNCTHSLLGAPVNLNNQVISRGIEMGNYLHR